MTWALTACTYLWRLSHGMCPGRCHSGGLWLVYTYAEKRCRCNKGHRTRIRQPHAINHPKTIPTWRMNFDACNGWQACSIGKHHYNAADYLQEFITQQFCKCKLVATQRGQVEIPCSSMHAVNGPWRTYCIMQPCIPRYAFVCAAKINCYPTCSHTHALLFLLLFELAMPWMASCCTEQGPHMQCLPSRHALLCMELTLSHGALQSLFFSQDPI